MTKHRIETDFGPLLLTLTSRDMVSVASPGEYVEGTWTPEPLTINRVDYSARFILRTMPSVDALERWCERVNAEHRAALPVRNSGQIHRASDVWPHWSISYEESWHGLRRVDNGEDASNSARKVLVLDLLDSIAIALQGMGTELDAAGLAATEGFYSRVQDRVSDLEDRIAQYRAVAEIVEDGVSLSIGHAIFSELLDNPRSWLIESMMDAAKRGQSE